MAEKLIQRKKVGEEAREAGDIMAKYGGIMKELGKILALPAALGI